MTRPARGSIEVDAQPRIIGPVIRLTTLILKLSCTLSQIDWSGSTITPLDRSLISAGPRVFSPAAISAASFASLQA
jgi:hypothetical protein